MREIARHRRGVREEGHAFALKRFAQFWFGEEPVDTKVHAYSGAGSVSAKQSG